MPVDAAPSLRRALRIVWVGVRREPRWFAFAVAGSTVYGVMTVLTAWAIGKVTREQVQPAVEAGHATAHQLWATFGWVAGVVCLNVVGVVIRRIAAQPWQRAFIFFKHEDEGKGPAFAKRFLEIRTD